MIPLSYAQQRLWFFNELDGSSAAYIVLGVWRLVGALDVPALRAALDDVVDRHESMRTVFPQTDGVPRQDVLPMDQVDVRWELADADEEQLTATLLEAMDYRFDLRREVPVRARLLRLAETEHVLQLVVHHIAVDGWSMGILLRDLAVAYDARCAGGGPQWEPLPVQYPDYALWQRELLGERGDSGGVLAEQLEYWTDALSGLPEQLRLPFDRPRPAVASYHGDVVVADVDAELHRRLLELARVHGATLFMVLHAAWAALLSRMGAGTDIPIGTAVAGRTDDALEDLIGFFINTLVLRTDLSGDPTFAELLERARKTDLDAFSRQDVPFEYLVEVLNPSRSLSRNPLFQTFAVLQNAQEGTLRLGDLAVLDESARLPFDTSKFDLTMDATESFDEDGRPAGICALLVYAVDLFERRTIEDLGRRFLRLLETVTADPRRRLSRIDVVLPAERELLLGRWNSADVEFPGDTVPEMFAAQVARVPDAPAVIENGLELSYAELDAASDRLARFLIARGIGPDQVVAIAMPRSARAVTALLAVAKAGGAHLPLDAEYPADRIAFMLADARPTLILTVRALEAALPEIAGVERVVLDDPAVAAAVNACSADPVADGRRPAGLSPASAAYVMYTSGSTGRPKGVVLPVSTITNLMQWQIRAIPDAGGSRVAQFTTLSFDVSLLEIYGSLVSGKCIVIPGDDERLDLDRFVDWLERERIRELFAPNVMIEAVCANAVERGKRLPDLVYLAQAGEALTITSAVRTFFAQSPEKVLFNHCGPTEVFQATAYTVPGSADQWPTHPPLGLPMPNFRVFVLDEALLPVPPGVPGELYLAGVALARGYVNRSGLTAERFVANPFGAPGERMYRTGDVVQWTHAGLLEFLGRADYQVKIRGNRVEPAEVESVLLAHPSVGKALVMMREDRPGDRRLVAYLTPGGNTRPDAAEVRGHVAAKLPSFMVPAAIVVLNDLPLSPNGKVDRRALSAPEYAAPGAGRAPRTPDEEVLCGLFADVLGVPRLGIDDDFFVLGGHSLLVTRLVSKVRVALGRELSVRDVFENPTVARMVECLSSAAAVRPALGPVDRPELIPLSAPQRRLWFIDQVEGPNSLYNLAFCFRLRGELDPEALRGALCDAARRHESLRTVFRPAAGEPCQVVLGPESGMAVTVVRESAPDAVAALLRAEAGRPFHLAEEPPVRALLVESGPCDHRLMLSFHHIAVDGWSVGPLWRDIAEFYRARLAGAQAALPELPLQYADYTLWQRALLGEADEAGSLMRRQLDYWRETLAGLPDRISLPFDRPRPEAESHRGGSERFLVPADLHRRLLDVAERTQTTVFMVMQAGLLALLHRLGAGEDIAVGAPVSGRDDAALHDLVGFFVNTVVLRTDLSGAPGFLDLLARARATDLGAFANQDAPFDRVVERVNPSRSLARNPLFQVMLVAQGGEDGGVVLPAVEVQEESWPTGTARFDITCHYFERRTAGHGPSGVEFSFEYSADLFDAATVRMCGSLLIRLLGEAVARPDRPLASLDLLDESQREAILADSVGPVQATTPLTLVDLFETQAARRPQATAVDSLTETLTYAELNRRANRLARHLVARGAGPEQFVAVALPRSTDLVVALLAVLKSGAAYLPIDLSYPAERIAYQLKDSAVRLAVVSDETARHMPSTVACVDVADPGLIPHSAEDLSDHERDARLTPAHAAYLIYTSGSTGWPKGVVVEHRSVVDYLAGAAEAYQGTNDSALVPSSPAFDLTVTGLFTPLVSGGTVVLAGLDAESAEARDEDGRGFAFLKTTPGQLALLDTLPADYSPTQELVLGGEPLYGEALERWRTRHPQAVVFNSYGPTEGTVNASQYRIEPGTVVPAGPVPIGRPMPGMRVYVLDAELGLVPPGVAGDVYLGGNGVARGYLGRRGLTAARFVADPFAGPGSRMYQTGDLARWRADGELVFLGRADDQVKIRGFRVEPGEVEGVLVRNAEVSQAVVRLHRDPHGVERLVAYVVPAAATGAGAEETVDVDRLRTQAATVLPGHMVPAAFVVLDRIPLTAHGKADHRALPNVEFGTSAATTAAAAPATPREIVLCDLFAEALGVARVGADENFFELGGHSLLAAILVNRVRTVLGASISIRGLFESPTAAALAASMDSTADGSADGSPFDVLLPIRAQGDQPHLFCVHPGGGLAWCYSPLIRHLDPGRPIYGLQARGLSAAETLPDSVKEMAADYVEQLRRVQPSGPYQLLGWSFGGLVAHAMACLLEQSGEQVDLLCLVDSYPHTEPTEPTATEPTSASEHEALTAIREALGDAPRTGLDQGLDSLGLADLDAVMKVYENNTRLAESYRPSRFTGQALFIGAGFRSGRWGTTAHDWDPHIAGGVEEFTVPGFHGEMMRPGSIETIARLVNQHLNEHPSRPIDD